MLVMDGFAEPFDGATKLTACAAGHDIAQTIEFGLNRINVMRGESMFEYLSDGRE
jgi:hypothetical protein